MREQSQGRERGQQQSNETALARPTGNEVEVLSQKYTKPDEVTAGMQMLGQRYNVLSPVRQINTVPVGHALTLAVVSIDPDGDTYGVEGGKRALTKSALDRIATAAGISWDPRYSGRLDDGSDPCYAHYKAVGTVRDPDGTTRTICGEKVMDLRTGSEQAKAAGKGLSMQRVHILSHAETKAKLRAIRSAVGIRSSYTPAEVQRPFVAVKLVETGDFGDEELNREYARLKMRKMLGLDGAAASLYGPPPTQALPCPEDRPTIELAGPARHAPPPVGAASDDRDDDAPPADVEQGEPIPFYELPLEAQQAELIELARRKGKLGTSEGQMSELQLRNLNDQRREDCWNRLSKLPDVAPEAPPATDDNGQTMPDWMR